MHSEQTRVMIPLRQDTWAAASKMHQTVSTQNACSHSPRLRGWGWGGRVYCNPTLQCYQKSLGGVFAAENYHQLADGFGENLLLGTTCQGSREDKGRSMWWEEGPADARKPLPLTQRSSKACLGLRQIFKPCEENRT